MLGNGNGGFVSTIDVPTGQSATDASVAALGDLNGDGKLDLGVVENSGTARQLVLLFGDGTGHFTPQSLSNTAGIFRVASADMNGDGSLDLVATGTSFLGVLLGDGAGHFANPTFFSAPTALELRVADLNGDGRADVALAMQRAGAGGAAVMLNACGRASTDLCADGQRLAGPGPGRRHADLLHDGHEQRAGRGQQRQLDRDAACLYDRNLGDAGGRNVRGSDGRRDRLQPRRAAIRQRDLGDRADHTGNGGVLTVTAGVGADQADPNPANNSLTVSTTVTAIGRTILVTNTSDSGPGSLRQAILDSNADAGDVDRISFNIPGAGVRTIAPLTGLPAITQPVVIDGTTQPGFAGTPIIELSGANVADVVAGLAFNSSCRQQRQGADRQSVPRCRYHCVRPRASRSAATTSARRQAARRQPATSTESRCSIRRTTSSAASLPASGNLISGNTSAGIVISSSGSSARFNQVIGNVIGMDVTGTQPVPNPVGIALGAASNNQIGGTTAAHRNVIAGNTQRGIVLEGGSVGNAILGNSITANGSLGIDLDSNGVTPNDAGDGDTGSNNRQNFPVLASAIASATTTTVAGSLNSAPNATFRIELFSNASCDASGNGEGQTLIASTSVTTNASGDATFTVDGGATAGVITATATDSNSNTSEFSACVPVTTVAPFSVGNTSDSGPGSLRQAILDANADPGTTDHISFVIPGSGVHTITLQPPLPPIASPLVIDGTTQPGYAVGAPLIELNGNGKTGLVLNGGESTIRGLVINGFSGDAIVISSAGNTIEGNLIGTDPSGTLARPNTGNGIRITGSSNVVGGTTASARNFIAGNVGDGVLVSGASAAGNRILGNYIGSNASAGGIEPFEAPNSLDDSDILSTQNGTVAITATRNHTLVGTRSLELTPIGTGSAQPRCRWSGRETSHLRAPSPCTSTTPVPDCRRPRRSSTR